MSHASWTTILNLRWSFTLVPKEMLVHHQMLPFDWLGIMVPLSHIYWNQKVIAKMIFFLIRSWLHGCVHTLVHFWNDRDDSIRFVAWWPTLKAGLARNTVRSFLLGTDQNIGTLTGVRIWHDCRGKSPEWYLHRVTVENLSNGEVFWFLCERWLAGFSFSRILIR